MRTRTRLGIAAVVTASMAAVLGATGGFSSAASSVLHMTQGVAHVAGVSNPTLPPKPPVQQTPSTAPPAVAACDQYSVVPTISGFSPTAGKAGAVVTVSGTGFIGTSEVTEVDLGTEPVSFTLLSSTSLTFSVPADAAGGPQTITVKNCKGTRTSTGSFTVWVAPSISGILPTHGGYGTSVAISGSGLTSTSSVKFFGGKAGAFTFVNDTEVDVTVPVGAKTGPITLTNAAGSTTSPTFTVDMTAPTITGFTPLIGEVGDTVTITGTAFDTTPGGTSVSFNGTDATTVSVASSTSLTADVPAGATSGKITVSTGGGAATSAKVFTVVGTPHITSFKPTIGVAGTTTVTITGYSFTHTTAVDFNGTNAPGFVVSGDTKITVKVPAGATTGPIHVTNDTLTTGQSSTDFTVIQAPAIGTVTPDEGGYGVAVMLTGSGFSGVTKVTFNGKPAIFRVASDTEIDTTVPVGAPAGSGFVVVTNPLGSSQDSFIVDSGAPTLTKFAPTSGAVGENVVLTGTNLNRNLEVTFGSGATQTFDNSGGSALSVTIEIPVGAETGPISVDNGVGVVTTKTSFTVLAAPEVVAFQPAFGKVGTKVTIYGDHLIGATEVDFGGVPAIAKPVYNKKDGSISAVVPTGAATGTITVKVRTPAGATLTGDSGGGSLFTIVTAKPTIAASPFTPSSGVAGTDVTIAGTGFIGPISVKFNGKASPFVSVTSDTELIARVPVGATSGVVSIANVAGPATSTAKFQITSISSFSPIKGAVGTTVTITGGNLDLGGAPTVRFGGSLAATVVSHTLTKVVVTVPATAATGTITVQTSAGTAVSAKVFTVT